MNNITVFGLGRPDFADEVGGAIDDTPFVSLGHFLDMAFNFVRNM